MFLELRISEYVDRAASAEPVPGGGSVAALCGALGSCMASMAANFTVGKKKFASVEEEMQQTLQAIEPLRRELLECMEQDSVAFGKIGAAYKLPKETEEQQAARKAAIQESLCGAMQSPLGVMRAAVKIMNLLPRLAEAGNPNLVSDTGVAAIFLEAAVRAAELNVAINLANIDDKTRCEQTRRELMILHEQADHLLPKIMKIVNNVING